MSLEQNINFYLACAYLTSCPIPLLRLLEPAVPLAATSPVRGAAPVGPPVRSGNGRHIVQKLHSLTYVPGDLIWVPTTAGAWPGQVRMGGIKLLSCDHAPNAAFHEHVVERRFYFVAVVKD